MEKWEIDLRSKLEKELSDGLYRIGSGNFMGWTGKGGQIEFEVALIKNAKDYIHIGEGIESQIQGKDSYTNLTREQLDNFLNFLRNEI